MIAFLLAGKVGAFTSAELGTMRVTEQLDALRAMGADPVDSLRQMKNTASDPYSGGRNFCNHYSVRAWNVVPVSSPIEVQFSMAPGSAIADRCVLGIASVVVSRLVQPDTVLAGFPARPIREIRPEDSRQFAFTMEGWR